MYIPGLNSCSTIIHLLVQYPRTVIAVGIVSTVAMQVSPIGPGPHLGSGMILQKYENRLIKETEIEKYYPRIMEAFDEVKNYPITDEEIKLVLNKCGNCTDISTDTIRSDNELYKKVKFLYFLEILNQTRDIEKAKRALRGIHNIKPQ